MFEIVEKNFSPGRVDCSLYFSRNQLLFLIWFLSFILWFSTMKIYLISQYLNLPSESVSSRESYNSDIKYRDYGLENNCFGTVGHMDRGSRDRLQPVPDFQVRIRSWLYWFTLFLKNSWTTYIRKLAKWLKINFDRTSELSDNIENWISGDLHTILSFWNFKHQNFTSVAGVSLMIWSSNLLYQNYVDLPTQNLRFFDRLPLNIWFSDIRCT